MTDLIKMFTASKGLLACLVIAFTQIVFGKICCGFFSIENDGTQALPQSPNSEIFSMVSFSACDQNFISTSSTASKNGTFKAPVFLNPEKTIRQCRYTFEALEGERVRIEFEDFELEGTPPE